MEMPAAVHAMPPMACAPVAATASAPVHNGSREGITLMPGSFGPRASTRASARSADRFRPPLRYGRMRVWTRAVRKSRSCRGSPGWRGGDQLAGHGRVVEGVGDAGDGLAALVALAGDHHEVVGRADRVEPGGDRGAAAFGDLRHLAASGGHAGHDRGANDGGVLAARVVVGADGAAG